MERGKALSVRWCQPSDCRAVEACMAMARRLAFARALEEEEEEAPAAFSCLT